MHCVRVVCERVMCWWQVQVSISYGLVLYVLALAELSENPRARFTTLLLIPKPLKTLCPVLNPTHPALPNHEGTLPAPAGVLRPQYDAHPHKEPRIHRRGVQPREYRPDGRVVDGKVDAAVSETPRQFVPNLRARGRIVYAR